MAYIVTLMFSGFRRQTIHKDVNVLVKSGNTHEGVRCIQATSIDGDQITMMI